MNDDPLITEYAKISDALINWFISQEIPLPRACGVMAFLTGVCIGDRVSNEIAMDEAVSNHLAVMQSVAKWSYANHEVK